jgi:hypothetical protein
LEGGGGSGGVDRTAAMREDGGGGGGGGVDRTATMREDDGGGGGGSSPSDDTEG